jgi:hypothetical protein
MEPLFRHTLPKRSDEPGNDDYGAMQPHRGCYALSDGASESFDPAQWARVLVDFYLANRLVDERWLTAACKMYGRMHDREVMSWSRQAAYDRGSFATLLGVTLDPSGRRASVTAIGDSLAVLADGGALVDSYPYTDASEFDKNPLLLATVPMKNQPLMERGLASFRREWNLSQLADPVIFCMTDALGAWVLADPSRIVDLRDLKTRLSFKALVDRERTVGRMRRDDTTLLVLGRPRA